MTDHLLQLGDFDQVSVQVGLHPGATLFCALQDTIGSGSKGLPAPWRQAVRAAIPATALDRVRPVLGPQVCWAPDALGLTGNLSLDRLDQVAEDLHGRDPDELAGEVVTHFQGSPPALWRALVDDPHGFLAAYVRVVAGLSEALAPRWHGARRLLAREVERVGVAAVTDTLDALLSSLPGPVHLRGDALRMPDPRAELGLQGRRLMLIPMVAGAGSSLSSLDRRDTVWFGYPVPGLGDLGAEPAAPRDGDPLSLTLGVVRATILRRLVQRPSVGEMANELGLGANTVTYHCDQLAAAGLLHRERHGRRVLLLPTERGAALVDLLLPHR
ncbi:hypothetical protein ACIQ6Y_20465 [Streptomyces sp. NPDC096205]|uniref:hypothetical protein n=1 Tax=Streptomyces sp. NPDC096205 TaxID=3366081 RepID=UPI003818CC43